MGAKGTQRQHVIACLCCDWKVETWVGMARMVGWKDITGPYREREYDFSGTCPGCQLEKASLLDRYEACVRSVMLAFRIRCIHKAANVYCKDCGKCGKCCRCVNFFGINLKNLPGWEQRARAE